MPLTDLQIDRYSRQIIVAGIGGRGQERLLASSIVVVGDRAEIEMPLAYLVGAGVGEIRVVAADQPVDSIVASMRDRNADVTIRIGDDISRDPGLVLVFIASASSVTHAARVFEAHRNTPAIVARLDDPTRVAVMPSSPPCPRCADVNLLAPPGNRSRAAEMVSMVSITEALKLLAGTIGDSGAFLLDFDGYNSNARTLAGAARCDCGASDQGGQR